MTAKARDIRIYPNPTAGFDVIVRVRGGIKGCGNHPTIEAALAAARAVEGRGTDQPIQVFERSLSEMLADAVAPALDRISAMKGKE